MWGIPNSTHNRMGYALSLLLASKRMFFGYQGDIGSKIRSCELVESYVKEPSLTCVNVYTLVNTRYVDRIRKDLSDPFHTK